MSVHEATVLHIKQGASLTSIANELVDRDWLEHPYYFVYEARCNDLAASIKSGEYEVLPGMTPSQLLELIVSGKVIQHSLTIVEGWTFDQIMETIRSSPHLEQTLELDDQKLIIRQIGLAEFNVEGRFFPDTYHFPTGTTDVDFLLRAYNMMTTVLESEWQQRSAGLPYKTTYEALIMASLIEKEAAAKEERKIIARVFIKRLQQNMKLQADPTVIYAVGKAFDGDIRQKDLSIDSPYNTYMYNGLPPTPIAAPGRASINAALQPGDGRFLYFVATGNGRHQFSETLGEHSRAVAKYQLERTE